MNALRLRFSEGFRNSFSEDQAFLYACLTEDFKGAERRLRSGADFRAVDEDGNVIRASPFYQQAESLGTGNNALHLAVIQRLDSAAKCALLFGQEDQQEPPLIERSNHLGDTPLLTYFKAEGRAEETAQEKPEEKNALALERSKKTVPPFANASRRKRGKKALAAEVPKKIVLSLNPDMLELLLSAKADVMHHNRKGENVLDLLAKAECANKHIISPMLEGRISQLIDATRSSVIADTFPSPLVDIVVNYLIGTQSFLQACEAHRKALDGELASRIGLLKI